GAAEPPKRPDPARKRPELLLLGPGDHIELGSAIRSACAFGWGHVFVEDRDRKWFTDDRITRSEGRGAARRGRNSIRVVPTRVDELCGFGEVCVVPAKCAESRATPLHQANLANGHQQIIVIPDECRIDVAAEDWERLGKVVKFVHLDVPNPALARRYRLTAS